MRTKITQCFATLLGLLMAAAVQSALPRDQSAATETIEYKLTRPFAGNPSSFASVNDAFQAIMLQSGLPGGEVITEGCGGEPHKIVRVHGATIGEALKSIEAEQPRYSLDVGNGVVDLLPREGTPPLLNVRIREFNSGASADMSSAGLQLFALPEVAGATEKLGLTRNASGSGLYAVSPGLHRQAPPLDIDLHDITVRDALNAIVRTNGSGIWIYREILCGTSKLFDIGFSH